MRRIKILIVLFVFYLSNNLCNGQAADTTRILFIGSSIIGYYHSVPDILDSLAVSGNKLVYSGDASLTGYTFEKHINNPNTLAKIAIGNWDYAYLACWGGVTNDTEDDYTYPWLKMLCDSLRKYNDDVNIILSMNHIRDSDVFYTGASGYDDPYWDDFYRSVLNKNTEGYKVIAQNHNTILDPYALVWDEIYIKKLPGINLYGPDEAHLNAFGAYLMASDVYSIIFNSSPEDLDYTYNLNSDTCTILRDASNKIVLGSAEEWGIISGIKNQILKHSSVSIFPNPARYYVYIDIASHNDIRVELTDYSTGRIILNENFSPGMEKKLSISNLPRGFYIVKILDGKRIKYAKLIISR